MALIAFLTGVYHVSRRKTVVVLWELLGVRISLGALSAGEARASDSRPSVAVFPHAKAPTAPAPSPSRAASPCRCGPAGELRV